MDNTPEKRRRGRPRKTERPEGSAHEVELPLMTYEDVLELRSVLFTKKIDLGKHGITKEQLTRLKEVFELDYDTLSAMLAVTNRALHLKKGRDLLNRGISERLIAIADVFSLGYNIFREREAFHTWLRAPRRSLGGLVPLQLMESLTGVETVKLELLRLDNFMI
ncbi:MbcA/ParS/Xre antitoxin family protein [Chitinophaga sp.]|uniref:MbcA/ParS/Xre antitoxin family protein n=1 Tax=Chitinophaga sp. TaxID=1869181 RepID=UPI00261E6F5E|nr:MbcA/ParS/Xre antitoxin family protein [uncultured Chitinophaga sp.]